MQLSAAEKTDALNIGLMLISCCIAIIIPFELFLFSYAILGPLHYLTEISWLHDKQYYTKGKYDAWFLILIGFIITGAYFVALYNLEIEVPQNFIAWLIYIALLSSIVFVFVKNNFYRIAGILLILFSFQVANNFLVFLTVFLPTIIHIYIFTGMFMLFGALKSKSRVGIASVVVLALCPVILFNVLPGTSFFHITDYTQNAYIGGSKSIGIFGVLIQTLTSILGHTSPQFTSVDAFNKYWIDVVFHSQTGILVARFIAFAYTYHYLNWFSKTRVIQWHKVPKARFAMVLAIWGISIAIYAYNYMLGMQWLFFLSFLHILLEFPLNYLSFAGVAKELRNRISPPALKKA